MKKKSKSLLLHLSVGVILTTTCVLMLFGIYRYQSNSRDLNDNLDQNLKQTVERLQIAIATPLYNIDHTTTNGMLRSEMQPPEVAAILILDSETKKTIYGFSRNLDGSITNRMKAPQAPDIISMSGPIKKGGEDLGTLQVFMTKKFLDEKLRNVFMTEALLIIILDILLVILVIALLKKEFVQPVVELTNVSKEIAGGNLNVAISCQSHNEIGILAESLGKMRDSLHEKIDGLQREVSFRKQVEQALREREEDLHITLNSIGDAVIATDAQGKVTRLNPVAEQLTGWTFEDAKGQPLLNIFNIVNEITRKACPNPVELVMKTGDIVGLSNNTVLISKDGTELQISDSGAPIRNTSGDILGTVLVFRDVTEKNKIEEQLLQSQKMDSVGKLAGGIAHDFNNMLGGIIGASDLLSKKLKDDPKMQKYVSMIINASERAADLTRKLLEFSRKAKIRSTPVNMHDAINSAIHILERSIDKRISLKMDLSAPKAVVTGDPAQLQNVVLNLAINARDAMPEGGEISFSSSIESLNKQYCKNSPFELIPGEYFQLKIQDTGIGMSKEIQSKIFEPFFTTKETGKGTGLGLSAVYGSVKDHKGEIRLYSEPGKGSVFKICLPLAVKEENKSSSPEKELPVQGKGKILVVDDETIVRTMAEAILEDLGYKTIMAEDGLEAIEIYQRNNDIDIILLDMIMPKMDGRETFRRIMEINPDAKILFSSGFNREPAMEELLEKANTDFVQKPYNQLELSKILARMLNG